MRDGRHDDHEAPVRRRRSQEIARGVRAGQARIFFARQPHLQGGFRGASSVGQDVGGPPARSTPATRRPAHRAAVGRVFGGAPADPTGRPVPGESGGGTEGAESPALAPGGNAPRSPPGLGGLRRPYGLACRGLKLSALVVHGAGVLAEDEGEGGGRQVGGELLAEVRGTAGTTACPVVTARRARQGDHPAAKEGFRPELGGAARAI